MKLTVLHYHPHSWVLPKPGTYLPPNSKFFMTLCCLRRFQSYKWTGVCLPFRRLQKKKKMPGFAKAKLKDMSFLFTFKMSIQKGASFLCAFLYVHCFGLFSSPAHLSRLSPPVNPSIPSINQINHPFHFHVSCTLLPAPTHSLKVPSPNSCSFRSVEADTCAHSHINTHQHP